MHKKITEEITSLKDDKIQLAKSLNCLKGRTENRKFLIEGLEAVDWAIDSGIDIDFILISKQYGDLKKKYLKYRIYRTSEGLLKKVTGTNYLIPIIGIGNYKKESQGSDFCIVLDNLQD